MATDLEAAEAEVRRLREKAQQDVDARRDERERAEIAECLAALTGLGLSTDGLSDWSTDDIFEIPWGGADVPAIEVSFEVSDRRVAGAGDPVIRIYDRSGRRIDKWREDVWVGGDEPPSVAAFLLTVVERLRQKIPPDEAVKSSDERPERWGTEDKMLWVGASKREKGDPAFRCVCGGNVFRASLDRPNHYKCNSCDETWTGEE